MIKQKHITTIFFLGLFISIGTGCSTSAIINSWTRPGTVARPYQKILILGLINEPDRTVRVQIETRLAENLKKLGYAAVCACEEFQPDTFYGLTEAQMLAQMEENSFDAVLTIVLLGKEKDRRSRFGISSSSGTYHQLWSYYQNAYDCVNQPEKYIETITYFWETNLYDLNDHGQVYSAQTKSFDPASVNSMASQFGDQIVKDMLQKNVLTNQSIKPRAF